MESTIARDPSRPERPDRRLQVLDAAVRSVIKYGYDGVRLKDVARECGVSVGLVQHHFDSRDELLAQALGHASDSLIQRWSAATGDVHDPWERIVALIDQLADDPDLRGHSIAWMQFCLVAARMPGPAASVRRVFAAWRQNLDDAVCAGVDSGAFSPRLPIADVVDVLLSLVDGCELAIAAGPAGMDGSRLRDLALTTARVTLGVSHA